jgi:hypothetical protein
MRFDVFEVPGRPLDERVCVPPELIRRHVAEW